jgi:ABC-type sugar transport system permease subunit
MFSYFGFINGWLQNLHITELPIEWFGTKFKAMFVLVLADTWRSFGVNVMYFMAAIQNVPEDVYEAAKIDGAGKLTTFFRITLPLIAPVMQVILMMSVIGTLGTNELVLVLTNGAPGGTTHTVKSYIFQNYAPGMADMNVNIGYGCAMSLVTGLILAAITLTYMKFSEKMKSIY